MIYIFFNPKGIGLSELAGGLVVVVGHPSRPPEFDLVPARIGIISKMCHPFIM